MMMMRMMMMVMMMRRNKEKPQRRTGRKIDETDKGEEGGRGVSFYTVSLIEYLLFWLLSDNSG